METNLLGKIKEALFDLDLRKIKDNPMEVMNIDNPSVKAQLYAVKADPCYIQYIKEPCEKVQLLAVGKQPDLIRFIENPTEKVQFAAIEKDPKVIKYIEAPCEKAQLYAVNADPRYIFEIKEPCEKAKLLAVEKEPDSILYIKNCNEKVQLAAIDKDPFCIAYINEPTKGALDKASELIESMSEKDKTYAITINPYSFEYIKNPSPQVADFAIRHDPTNIRFIENPNEDLQLKAFNRACENASLDGDLPIPCDTFIGNINNPTEKVQLLAVRTSPFSIEYIKNPCEAAWTEAIRRYPDYAQLKESLSQNTNEIVNAAGKIPTGQTTFSGGRKQMTITGDHAVITANGQNFDATGILSRIKNEGVDINKVSQDTMNKFLKGKHVQLPGANPDTAFALAKGPTGYAIKVLSAMKQTQIMATQEM